MSNIFTKISLVALLALPILGLIYKYGRVSASFMEMNVELAPELADQGQGARTLFFIFYKETEPSSKVWVAYREQLEGPLVESRKFVFNKEKIQLYRDNWQAPDEFRGKIRLDLDGFAGPDQPGDIIGWLPMQPIGSSVIVRLDSLVTSDTDNFQKKEWEGLSTWSRRAQRVEDMFGNPTEQNLRDLKGFGYDAESVAKELMEQETRVAGL